MTFEWFCFSFTLLYITKTQNISTSLDGIVSSDGKGGYFVRGADPESTAAKLLVINKKILVAKNKLDQIEDIYGLDDPRRIPLINEINKLQREEAELEGREYDPEFSDLR